MFNVLISIEYFTTQAHDVISKITPAEASVRSMLNPPKEIHHKTFEIASFESDDAASVAIQLLTDDLAPSDTFAFKIKCKKLYRTN